MSHYNRIINSCLALALIGIVSTCSEVTREASEVKLRINSFPNTINTVTSNSFQAYIIQKLVFNSLITFDEKGIAKPLLAKSLPEILEKDSLVHINYQIREEARWDDGSPITFNDVEFSLKLYKAPFLLNSRMRTYLDGITEIVGEKNSKSFTLVGKGSIEDLRIISGDFDILQRNKYDSLDLLSDVHLLNLEDSINDPEYNINVKLFLKEFLDDNFIFKNRYFNGAGPYEIKEIISGKFIQLKKKNNWWGSNLNNGENQFTVVPEYIQYITIPEDIVALNALRNQDLDVLPDLKSSDFISLKNDLMTSEQFAFFAPLKYRFTYIAFNSRLEKFKRKGLRTALAHLLNVEGIIKGVEQGYATRTIGPINPVNSSYYNPTISPRKFDPSLAVEMLRNEGYIKKKNRWYEKGSTEHLSLKILTRPNPVYEYIAEVFKEEASNIGIETTTEILDGRVAVRKMRNHDFEIAIGSLTGNPYSLNFHVLFSQESGKLGGRNYSGFGNNFSDSLILASNLAKDSTSKRKALFKLQKELHDEATMLFLYFSQNKIAVSKRFHESSLKISSIRPGYDVTSFKLKEDYQEQ